jgi:hypothetical protein
VTYQAGIAQCSDAKPSDAPEGAKNVEEILAANPIAAIEVISHGGFSCSCRIVAAWSGRQSCCKQR